MVDQTGKKTVLSEAEGATRLLVGVSGTETKSDKTTNSQFLCFVDHSDYITIKFLVNIFF